MCYLRLTTITALVLITTIIIGCTPISPADEPHSTGHNPHGGAIVVAIPQDPDGLDPHQTVAAATFEVTINIYDTLVAVNTTGEIVPALAASWNNSPDGLTWTFTIRDNITFHDGRPCTAQDVKASFLRLLDPDTGHPRLADYQVITDITTPDDHTVQFILSEYQASFLSNLAMGWAAVVDVTASDLRNQPQGTGAFRFVDWTVNQHLTLARHDSYWHDALPYLDQVKFVIIPDPSVAVINLRTGDVDIVARVSGELAAELTTTPELKLETAPLNMVQLMAVNNSRPPLTDVRVRRALNHAVDRSAVITGAAWGYGTPIGSHMPPVVPAYVDLTHSYPYDQERARQLLTEAGYPDGFSITLSLPQPYELHCRAGEIIAAQLAEVGIQVQIEIVEWSSWLEDVYFGRDYDLTVIAHTGRLDSDPFLNRYVTGSKENYMNFSHDRYDELIATAVTEIDSDQRLDNYREAQRILSEQAAAVYLQAPHGLVGMKREINGWNFYPVNVIDVRTVYCTQ